MAGSFTANSRGSDLRGDLWVKYLITPVASVYYVQVVSVNDCVFKIQILDQEFMCLSTEGSFL